MIKFKYAIPLILCAALMNAFQAAFVKMLSGQLSESVIIFGRCLVNMGFLSLSVLLLMPQKPIETVVKTKRIKVHFIRAFSGILAIYLYYYCLKRLSLSIATLLFFSAPLFVPFVARIWIGVRIAHRLFWGMIISLGGIVLILQPGAELFRIEIIIGLFSGLCVAVSNVSIRRLHHTENSARIMFYYFLVGIVVSGTVVLFTPGISLSREDLYYLLILGIVTTAFQGFSTAAYKFGPARLLSPFLYCSVGFAVILDIIYWNKTPHLKEIIGMILIALGASLTAILYPKKEVIPK